MIMLLEVSYTPSPIIFLLPSIVSKWRARVGCGAWFVRLPHRLADLVPRFGWSYDLEHRVPELAEVLEAGAAFAAGEPRKARRACIRRHMERAIHF